MKKYIKLVLSLVVALVVASCSSTLHLYPGQQYLTDAELGTLVVTEQFKIYKFDRKEVYKTPKPPVIKALPGEHRIDITAYLSEEEPFESTVYWDAVEGRTYQLTLSESNDVTIVDVTDN